MLTDKEKDLIRKGFNLAVANIRLVDHYSEYWARIETTIDLDSAVRELNKVLDND